MIFNENQFDPWPKKAPSALFGAPITPLKCRKKKVFVFFVFNSLVKFSFLSKGNVKCVVLSRSGIFLMMLFTIYVGVTPHNRKQRKRLLMGIEKIILIHLSQLQFSTAL